jgi:hypothetical protein
LINFKLLFIFFKIYKISFNIISNRKLLIIILYFMKKKNKNINQKNIITKNMFTTKEKVYNPNKYIFFIRKRKSYTICNHPNLLK